MDSEPTYTVDEEPLLSSEARSTSRLYYRVGFFLLPWFWVCNVWLFWPTFISGGPDAIVASNVRKSGVWLTVYTTAFLAWFLAYQLDGRALLGDRIYNVLDIRNLDLGGTGFGG